MDGNLKINIKAFRAIDDLDFCETYIDGHRRILDAYGVSKVTSASTDWKYDPSTYIIIIYDSNDTAKIYGGARIQVRTETLKMPMEGAIAILDKNIYNYVDQYGNYNVAEFCGLWNSIEVSGYGIGSMLLGRIGVAISNQLNLQCLMALCSPATLRNCIKLGFEKIEELGNKGTFYYPKEDLIATALIIKDIRNLPTADPFTRDAIMNLRNNPVQFAVETGPKGQMEIQYDITIDVKTNENQNS